jgi:hypothetical protein
MHTQTNSPLPPSDMKSHQSQVKNAEKEYGIKMNRLFVYTLSGGLFFFGFDDDLKVCCYEVEQLFFDETFRIGYPSVSKVSNQNPLGDTDHETLYLMDQYMDYCPFDKRAILYVHRRAKYAKFQETIGL